jgi:hypothetical protein
MYSQNMNSGVLSNFLVRESSRILMYNIAALCSVIFGLSTILYTYIENSGCKKIRLTVVSKGKFGNIRVCSERHHWLLKVHLDIKYLQFSVRCLFFVSKRSVKPLAFVTGKRSPRRDHWRPPCNY